MNKVKTISYFLAFIVLFLSGCQSTDQTREAERKLSKAESTFTWSKDRERVFGKYDYNTSKEEALSDIKEKFDIELLPAFDKEEALLIEELQTEEIEQEKDWYVINATGSNLSVTSIVGMKNDEEEGSYLIYGKITAQYKYLENSKKIVLVSQKVEVVNDSRENTYHGKNLSKFLSQIGEVLEINDLEQSLADFEEVTRKPEDLKSRTVSIYDDIEKSQKNKGVGKSFGVKYDSNGILTQIYANTVDYGV